MSYLKKHLVNDESIIYEAKISHWSLLGYYILGTITLVLMGLGLVFFALAWIKRSSTELGITNRRVISKFGFIRRDTTELPLSRIESIRVHQSVMGRMFNFGTIVISGAGNPTATIPNIADPMSFRSAVLNTQ